MANTWAYLTADADFMRAGNEPVFNAMVEGTITLGDATVENSQTENLAAGMVINGAGIPDGTTILSITDSETFEMSANATSDNQRVEIDVEIYTDAQLIDLYKDVAKDQMYADISASIDNSADNADVIDDIVESNNGTKHLEITLSKLQLYFFYLREYDIADTENGDKLRMYQSAYESAKNGFGNLKRSDTAAIAGGRIKI